MEQEKEINQEWVFLQMNGLSVGIKYLVTKITIKERRLRKVAQEVSKDSKFTFSLETLAGIGTSIFLIVGMWFTLQADIEEAKELPVPEVGRTEYDLKDQMIRNTIIETQKDVTEMKEEQKEMRNDVKNIERMMMQK